MEAQRLGGFFGGDEFGNVRHGARTEFVFSLFSGEEWT